MAFNAPTSSHNRSVSDLLTQFCEEWLWQPLMLGTHFQRFTRAVYWQNLRCTQIPAMLWDQQGAY
eukprot:3347070-Amphidinium_carterae.1